MQDRTATKHQFIRYLATALIIVLIYLLSGNLPTLIRRINEMASTKKAQFEHEVLGDWTRPSTCPSLLPRNITSARVEPLLALNYNISQAFQHVLSRYIAWHKSVGRRGPSACARILVWSCCHDIGLGDQVRGALHALMLAIETERYLVLDPPSSTAIFNTYEPSAIDWRQRVAVKRSKELFLDFCWFYWKPQLTSASVFEKKFGAQQVVRLRSHAVPEYESLVGTKRDRRDCHAPGRPRECYYAFEIVRPTKWVQQNCYTNGRPRRCNYGSTENIDVNRLAHQALFRYKQVDVQSAHEISSSLGLRSRKYLAIHARVGANLDDPSESRFMRYHEAPGLKAKELCGCAAKVAPDIREVYVASDNENFKAQVVRQCAARNLTAHPGPLVARHSANLNKNKWRGSADPAVRNTAVDALLMGDAQVLITSGSGLSNMAAFGGHSKLVDINEC